MRRRPEPAELMDEPGQARAYAEADFSEPHDAFVTAFRARFPDYEPRRVLDLGCGPADVTVRFARAYPLSECLGIDGAPAMLKLGRKAVAAAGLEARITLAEGYLPGAAIPSQAFDTVLSNSLLHHLADPGALWTAARAAGAPGAAVLVMDLRRPATPEAAARLVDEYASDAPEVLRRDFHNSLYAAYTPAEVRAQLAAAGLDRHLEVTEISDRHWLAWGRLPDAGFANGPANG